MIIYLLTCTVNGIQYIGQADVPLEERWKRHVASSRCPTSQAYKRMPVVRAIAEHGPDNFIREIIEECLSYDAMDEAEIDWIAKLDMRNPEIGYNVARGGNAPMRGRKHTVASKALMSEAKLNMSDETRAAMKIGQARANADPETLRKKSEAATKSMLRPERRAAIKAGNAKFFENGMPEDVKQKLREAMSGENNANYGKAMPEERRLKLSATMTGRTLSEEHKAAIGRGGIGRVSPNKGVVFDELRRWKIAHGRKLPIVFEKNGVALCTAFSFADALALLRVMEVRIGRLRLANSIKLGTVERGFRFYAFEQMISKLRSK